MTSSLKLIEEGRKDELWNKHCGYVNLSKQEFMDIQNRLMLEQIKLLGASNLGKHFMGSDTPTSVEEFRRVTPLTRISDYDNLLCDKSDENLPVKPYVWARTSGRTSDIKTYWLPYSRQFYDHLSDSVIAAMLMSSCSHRGEVKLERNDKFLMATAPRPYVSGFLAASILDNLHAIFLPSLEEGEKMEYMERIATGFKLAMQQGLDYFGGLSIVLAKMGEQFETQSSNSQPSKELLNITTLLRLLRAVLISKINKRNILPKDIWKLKGIMAGGTDSEIYKDKIEYYWGKKPLEGFSCTEGGNLCFQSWNFKGMTFFPDNAFLEFIPLDEVNKNKANPAYQPKTVLMDELKEGIYELVISNFMGGALIRYRLFDMFKVLSIGDEEIDSELPQVQFYSRTDDIINISSYLILSEREIWKAIEATGIKYQDWTANKEIINGTPYLHLYIELKEQGDHSDEEMINILDKQFSNLFQEYCDLKEDLQINPLLFTRLSPGSFKAYKNSMIEAGVDLEDASPSHMRPSRESLNKLLTILSE
ncbi:MAG: GH3 auxin-responsive promoter family protein [Chloroflexota bacterium]